MTPQSLFLLAAAISLVLYLGYRAIPRTRNFLRLAKMWLHNTEKIRLLEERIGKVTELNASHIDSVKNMSAGFNIGVEGKKRNIIFLHQSYYHFYYLSAALRRRGWDASLVTVEPVGGAWDKYYHGYDINLFHPDQKEEEKQIAQYFQSIKKQCDILHFAGDGSASFSPNRFSLVNEELSEDFRTLKKNGKKWEYIIIGCNSGVSKEQVKDWSLLGGKSVCDVCAWNDNPAVCDPGKTSAWGRYIEKNCDLICAENSPALGAIASPQTILEPLTMCLDSRIWSPNIQIPDKHKLEKRRGVTYIYHAVGEYKERSKGVVNIKGTQAIMHAVEKLKHDGFRVELVFATGVKNIEVKYLQQQSDIIVDQLNYGRYGANAREGLMLGKPVVCYLNRNELSIAYSNIALDECPIVSASEDSVYDVLKELVQSEKLRAEIGSVSRRYALKWHDAERCAARYEYLVDRHMFDGAIDRSTIDFDRFAGAS